MNYNPNMEDTKAQEFKFDGTKLRPYLTKSVTKHAKDLGISRVYFSLILTGKKTPSTDLVMTICKNLNAPLEDLAVIK